MGKNRKTSRRASVMMDTSRRIFGILIVCTMVVLVNHLASTKCSHVQESIGKKERELESHERTYTQEYAKWCRMTSPDALKKALPRHGIKMESPSPLQIVDVDSHGNVRRTCQWSLAEAKRKALNYTTVRNTSIRSRRRQ